MQPITDEFNFDKYLRIIRGRRKTIIIFFFATVFLVGIVSFSMAPVYVATVTLLIDVESPYVLTTTGNVELGGTNYYAYREYFQSQAEIIKSRSIARQVFDDLNLGQDKSYQNAEDPIGAFLGNIEVEQIPDTRLLYLHVSDRNAQHSADIANRLAEVYVARNLAYITKSEVMNLLKNEYLTLQARLSEESKIYKHKHPKMIRLKEEIAQMTARIREETGRASGQSVADNSSGAKSSVMLTGLKANNVTIQDRAEPPLWPSKPKKRLNILIAMIVGLFGGTSLAFFFEYLDDTVKGSEEIEKLVSWPYLGSIPNINGKKNMTELERDLFVHTKPRERASEAYRSIRTSALFSSTDEHSLRSIVITSPGPREGKTTTLCNLGICMAQGQKKVLLVDADMRRPRLHGIFKDKNETGLSSFLAGQAGFGDIVQKTEINNLSLVSGGPHPPNPSELLSSHKMKEFIDSAKSKFDFILFDTPPVAIVTDAVILSQAVDGTIVVVEEGGTHKRSLPRIAKILDNVKTRIIGTLLNKSTGAYSSYYYSYYYSGKRDV